MGFFADRDLEARLAFLHGYEASEDVPLDAAILEDSAFLLLEQVKRDGYLRPVIEGRFETEEGGESSARWETDYEVRLPVDFEARRAVFRIEPGVLYYYKSAEVLGLDALPEEALSEGEAQRYFIPGGFLVGGRAGRVFTRENLERRTQRLLRSLEATGYRSAEVVERDVNIDDESGAVRIRLRVEPGPLHEVGEVERRVVEPGEETRTEAYPVDAGVAYTREWERGVREELTAEAFEAGYPDARVRMEELGTAETEGGVRRHKLRFTVERGRPVTLEDVRFEGDADTRRSLLRRQVGLDRGAALNRLEAMEGRRKLMGLGIFDEVDLGFDPSTGGRREAVYTLTPSVRKELRARVGWGSYELARLGFEWEHRNPFGRAHRYLLGLKQSFKSSRAEAEYAIPQIFGTDMSAYSNFWYRDRQELSFDRSSIGGSVGLSKQFESGLRVNAEYGVSREEVERSDGSDFVAETDATVAGLEFSASLDRRNDVLSPTYGYSLFASYQIAGAYLGGDVSFQKAEGGGTVHFPLAGSLVVHGGLRGGVVFSVGEAERNIPFGERFFTGGEDSVRGFREGEASPLDASGDAVGAESYVLMNLELEQRVLKRLSVVLFLDVVTSARDGCFEDEADTLGSAGLGMRYHTPVGPLRVEYGHNLNPREDDPSGTLHFSIGFPF